MKLLGMHCCCRRAESQSVVVMLHDFLTKHVNALASWAEHTRTRYGIPSQRTSWTTVQILVRFKNSWDTAMLQRPSGTRT
jgi:hypothetical protein